MVERVFLSAEKYIICIVLYTLHTVQYIFICLIFRMHVCMRFCAMCTTYDGADGKQPAWHLCVHFAQPQRGKLARLP